MKKQNGKIYTFNINPSNKPELNRVICKFCHTKAMDKFYGVNRNADNEKTLYGK